MLRHFLLVIVFLSEVFVLQSQTVVLQPTSNLGKDAMIRIGDNGTSDGNTNFGTEVAYIAGRTNISGVWYKIRSLIQFDLSSIPQKAIITSATLTFYGLACIKLIKLKDFFEGRNKIMELTLIYF